MGSGTDPGIIVSDIPARVRKAVHARAQGKCEGCGKFAPLELHHRKYRSRGGKHTVENIVALHGWGNHTGCHGLAHSADAPKGWALPSGRCDPAEEVFVALDGRVLLFLADGRAVETSP